MYNFLLQLFLIASLTVIIYLMARALPRVQEDKVQTSLYNYLENWVRKLPLAKMDNSLSIFLEKTLRRTRVVVMKFDNVLQKRLNSKNNGSKGMSSELINHLSEKNGNK